MTIIETIQLDKNGEKPLYLQLYEILFQYITEGKLRHGEQLPPIRKLAEQLGVNNVTVVNAYRMLEKHNLVYKTVGSGTFVSLPAATMAAAETNLYNETTAGFDFASATLSPELFPVADFKRIMNEVIEREGGRAFSSEESQGVLCLRQEICNFLRNYQLQTQPEQIQIISGAQQGIDILAKSLLNPGDCVIVEKPTYTGAFLVFQGRGAKVCEVPMAPDGMQMETLVEMIEKFHPKLIYVMPDFQNPTGYRYSLAKRQALLQLAKKHDFYLIEDDQLSELRYTTGKVPLLKALDLAERVIYIKSFSKLLIPGVRLGFLVMPPQICDRVLKAKQFTDITTSGFTQRVLAEYLRQDCWQEQLERVRLACQKRYGKLLAVLQATMPDWVSYARPDGGLYVWVRLADGYSAQELSTLAAKRQVNLLPGHIFFPTQHTDQYFRLSFAAIAESRIEEGMKILAQIIKYELPLHNQNNQNQHNYMPLL